MSRLIDADALPKYTGMALSAVEVAMAVENAPTIDAEPVKHGHWVYVGHGWAGESIRKCSMCGHQTPDDGNYCPYCGAKMDEVTDGKIY